MNQPLKNHISGLDDIVVNVNLAAGVSLFDIVIMDFITETNDSIDNVKFHTWVCVFTSPQISYLFKDKLLFGRKYH